MRLLLTKPSIDFGPFRVALNCGKSKCSPAGHRFLPIRRPVFIKASSTGEQHSRDSAKSSSYLSSLRGRFSNGIVLEEMPQVVVKAKLILEERLLHLGKNVFKWCLAVLLGCSLVSDVILAVSVNRELLVPLGLFVGVTLADFLKESFLQIPAMSQEQGGNDTKQLWGIGLIFVALRIVFLRFRMAGWLLFAHIGDGGLMQILWLLSKQPQQPEEAAQNEEEHDLKETVHGM